MSAYKTFGPACKTSGGHYKAILQRLPDCPDGWQARYFQFDAYRKDEKSIFERRENHFGCAHACMDGPELPFFSPSAYKKNPALYGNGCG
ncbi:hypothetical protein ACFPLB_11080 [Aquamicrobium segne]|uniref:Uncharacterized protein n=1 Tax=Aquamicrobium segne TaxID=469547 RepID=A0ABW0GXW6_9HYPH